MYVVTVRWGFWDTAASPWSEIQQHGEYLLARGPDDIRPRYCQLGPETHDGGLTLTSGPGGREGEGRCQPHQERGKSGRKEWRGGSVLSIQREPATSGHHTQCGALSAIYRIVCVWYEESPPSPILSFEDWVSIMTCITQTLSWHGQVADKASCHPDMDKGDNYSAWVWLLQLHPTIHITIYRARTHTRQIRARLVGCEGWLGLDGRPSLHRPYGVTHTRCAPAPLWPISP